MRTTLPSKTLKSTQRNLLNGVKVVLFRSGAKPSKPFIPNEEAEPNQSSSSASEEELDGLFVELGQLDQFH
jgi:hypothetical protein